MKNLFYIVVFQCLTTLLMSSDLLAQKTSLSSHYLLNQSHYNPAYAGIPSSLNFDGVLRAQWIGIEGAPVTQSISAHVPVPLFNSGFGINFSNDVLGAGRTNEFGVSYSYRIIQKGFVLSSGIRLGGILQNIDNSLLVTPTGNYDNDVINHQDDLLSTTKSNAFAPNLNLGLYFKSDNIEAGLVFDRILNLKYSLGIEQSRLAQQQNEVHIYMNYFVEIGYNFSLQPMLMLSTDFANIQTSIGTFASYRNFLDAGISLRGYNNKTLDALIGLLKYRINEKLVVAYAYDYPISSIRNVSTQTHELSILYRISNFLKTNKKKIIFNPRFM